MKIKKTSLYILSFAFLLVACKKEISNAPVNNLQNAEIANPYPISQPTRGTLYSWANDMVLNSNINKTNTFYQTNDALDKVIWGTTASAYKCTTDCSGFFKALVMKTYGYDAATFGGLFYNNQNPKAVDIYNAIMANHHFDSNDYIMKDGVVVIKPGDIIVYTHPPTSENNYSTGHVMIVAATPTRRTNNPQTAPIIRYGFDSYTSIWGTYQWDVPVIDVASSGHGSADTRKVAEGTGNSKNKDFYTGFGKGTLRLYTNENTINAYIKGHTWSTYSNSIYHSDIENPIIVGRFRTNLP